MGKERRTFRGNPRGEKTRPILAGLFAMWEG